MKHFFKKTLIVIMLALSLTLSACAINLSDLLDANSTDIVNDIHKKGLLTSNVTVLNYNYKGGKISQGSGVIYKYENGYYYIITNNHVVNNVYAYQIMDAYGEFWRADLVKGDENYDLAVVKFKATTNNYFYIPEIANTNPNVNDKLISIGNPNGVINSVTFGEIIGYQELAELGDTPDALTEGSNVSFKVLKHNAPIEGGSSGSAIFNYDYKICGINFATGRDENGNYLSSYAIQPSKVIEFLTNNNLI